MLKLHVVGSTPRWQSSEEEVFTARGQYEIVTDPALCDVLVLTGGVDIDPSLYGEEKVTRANQNYRRDQFEIAAVWRAPAHAFKFGICRGGQLLNVLAGGRLWQDVDGHEWGDHMMLDLTTGQNVRTSSVHHQAFRPTPEAEIIATCNVSTRKLAADTYWEKGVQDDVSEVDIEVCYYPGLRYLCIQGHPEYGDKMFADYCHNLMQQRI